MLRAALSLLSRSLLWMTLSAVIVLCAMRYGPTLLAQTLPEAIRPAPSEVAKLTPQRLLDALKEIRGAL
jgi:hypothetical protein